MLHQVRRAAARGLTLVEVMVVIAILGLISAGIAVGVMKRMEEARRSTTETNARALRQVAMGWRLSHEIDACPTAATLVHDGALDEASRTKDAWGTPFAIECEADRTIVRSFGPDRVMGGEDDIVIPPAASASS
jgi:general secretion pathway protein G